MRALELVAEGVTALALMTSPFWLPIAAVALGLNP